MSKSAIAIGDYRIISWQIFISVREALSAYRSAKRTYVDWFFEQEITSLLGPSYEIERRVLPHKVNARTADEPVWLCA